MNDRLRQLRVKHKMTQEMLAEKLNVSRQTVAKWENSESVPDVMKCSDLAGVFGLELEDIAVLFLSKQKQEDYRPSGKYIFGRCVLSDHKVKIPQEAMDIFGIEEGDELLLMGDVKQGLALMPISAIDDFVKEFQNAPVLEVDDHENSN